MHRIGLCINLNSYVAYNFYVWSFSHNTAVPISMKHNKCDTSLNKYSTVFDWGSVNSNKNITYT